MALVYEVCCWPFLTLFSPHKHISNPITQSKRNLSKLKGFVFHLYKCYAFWISIVSLITARFLSVTLQATTEFKEKVEYILRAAMFLLERYVLSYMLKKNRALTQEIPTQLQNNVISYESRILGKGILGGWCVDCPRFTVLLTRWEPTTAYGMQLHMFTCIICDGSKYVCRKLVIFTPGVLIVCLQHCINTCKS